MKKILLAGMAAACLPLTISAQSAIDAMSLSANQLRGTARFMSMGGAFTALGGDLSVLGQNPGGIGIYRSSEVGLSLDLNFQNATSHTQGVSESSKMTRFTCNNFGYIGAVRTGSDLMPYFNWGVSYGRTVDFNRKYKGRFNSLNGSLSNYITGYTTAEGWPSQELNSFQDGYNPYWDSSAPWMSILAYNSYLINSPTQFDPDGENNEYVGLWKNGTSGSGTFDVREKGYVDEYNIDFGGNFNDVVYWGLGFGITDIDFSQSVYYTEDLTNAQIPNATATGVENGNGGFGLDSWKKISGTGFNFKVGLIVKPINEFRIGFAVHTPTYYNLTQQGWAGVDYGFSSGYSDYMETDDGYTSSVDWKLRTPWRLMVGMAGVIAKKAIVSVDYEYRPYKDMHTKLRGGGGAVENINSDIQDYYQSSNIIRIGTEYRLNGNWSVRAGYSYETTPCRSEVKNNELPVYTSGAIDVGTTPSYSLDNQTQYVSCGIGYHYKNFYADAAYVYRYRSSEFHAYTPSDYNFGTPPHAKITETQNNVVISLGFRF